MGSASSLSAQDTRDLVGTWYGEGAQSGKANGKDYDFRRWLAIQRPDGTGSTLFRYYLGDRVQAEVTDRFEWAVEGGVYREVCRSSVVDGVARSCSGTSRYKVESLNPREMRYTSERTGRAYRMLKVPDDFRLP